MDSEHPDVCADDNDSPHLGERGECCCLGDCCNSGDVCICEDCNGLCGSHPAK